MPSRFRRRAAPFAAAVLAVAVVGVVGASGSTGRTVRIVSKPLLQTKHGAVFCGLKPSGGRKLLVCWVPKSGFTVRLTPAGGIPKGDLVKKNRGKPPKPAAFRLLRVGQKLDSPPFHCRGMKAAEVRCSNGAQHGFQLGPKSSFLL